MKSIIPNGVEYTGRMHAAQDEAERLAIAIEFKNRALSAFMKAKAALDFGNSMVKDAENEFMRSMQRPTYQDIAYGDVE